MNRIRVLISLVFAGFLSVRALTVANLKQNQVIPRTSQQSADFVVNGTCKAGIQNVQFQVTQQGSTTPLAGFAWKSAGASISGTEWSAPLRALPVGGEYAISLRGTDASGTVVDAGPTMENILVGDIWLASGQSNMGGASEATASNYVRGFNLSDKSWSRTRHNLSVAFGTTVQRNSGVPVGVAVSVCSGCEISIWGDGQPFLDILYQHIDYFQENVKGFIWYQGETDSENHDNKTRTFLYRQRLSRLIGNIRTRAKNPSLACLVVQIGSLYPAGAIFVRGAQYDVSKDDPYTATIPVYDLGADLHLTAARLDTAGERLGYACLRKIFGLQNQFFGPQYKNAWFMDTERKKIAVQFASVKGTLAGFAGDRERWGFFVMDTAVWRRNDSTLSFSYSTPGLLLPIDTVTRIAPDRLCVQLKSPATAPVSISYGRNGGLSFLNLDLVTDETGIPMPTTFNYPVLPNEPSTRLEGNVQLFTDPEQRAPARWTVLGPGTRIRREVPGIYSIDGRAVLAFPPDPSLKRAARISILRLPH